jgi:hypothetical protein
MSATFESLSALVENAQAALCVAAADADPASVSALTIAVLSLHCRVARVPWSHSGDRELYVSAVVGALTVQRGRIAALSERHDHAGLLESCRLSLQTLAAIVRDVERIFPTPAIPPRKHVTASQRPRFRAGPLETTGPMRSLEPGLRAIPAA